MRKHRSIILGITLATLSFTTHVLASGTYNPGGGGGNDYHLAKLIFYKKVVCGDCPFPGRGKDSEDAQALLQELSESDSLTDKEREAAINYLLRRFKLN